MLARKRALGRSTVRSMLYEWSRKRRDVTSPEVFSDEEASFMTRFAFRVLVVAMILALLPTVSFAAGESSAGSANTTAAPPAATSPAATTAASPSPATSLPGSDPLLNLLVSKGLLTQSEATNLAGAAMPEVRKNVLLLLRDKGILTNADLNALNVSAASAATSAAATLEPAAPQTTGPTTPAVIAAVAPVRVLQVDPPKREGLIPDIKMGSGARLKPYGFFKASVVHD